MPRGQLRAAGEECVRVQGSLCRVRDVNEAKVAGKSRRVPKDQPHAPALCPFKTSQHTPGWPAHFLGRSIPRWARGGSGLHWVALFLLYHSVSWASLVWSVSCVWKPW